MPRPRFPILRVCGSGTNSALLGYVVVVERALAGVACASHGGEKLLQFADNGVDGQAGVSAFWVQAEPGAERLGEDGEGDVTWSRPSPS